MTEVPLVSLINMINGKSKVSEELNLRQVIYQQTLISWQKSGCRNTQAPLFLYTTPGGCSNVIWHKCKAIAEHKNVSQPRSRILRAIAISKYIHQMMMHTSEIDTANSDEPADIDTLINNAAWAIRKTYHKILKASPGAAQHSNMTQSSMSRS